MAIAATVTGWGLTVSARSACHHPAVPPSFTTGPWIFQDVGKRRSGSLAIGVSPAIYVRPGLVSKRLIDVFKKQKVADVS
jgi:hypothetical protein